MGAEGYRMSKGGENMLKRILSGLLLIVLSVSLIGCTPSEDEIYDILEGIEEGRNYTMESSLEMEYWGQTMEVIVTMETDGHKYHLTTVGSLLGTSEEGEYYYDGEYLYTLNNGSWEKEHVEDAEDEGKTFSSWDIDSISKSSGTTIVKGTVNVDLEDFEDVEDNLKSAELDFKLKLDKMHNVESLIIKGKDVTTDISSIRIKIYDINETDVDLPKV